MGTVSESHAIDSLTKVQAERLRLLSLTKCIEQLNSKPRQIRDGKRICHPIMVWTVSPTTRRVMKDSNQLTYACELAPSAMTYLVNRTSEDTHAVVEFLDSTGGPQARFLVRILETKPAIRGLYLVNASILCRMVTSPEATIFNKGYFAD